MKYDTTELAKAIRPMVEDEDYLAWFWKLRRPGKGNKKKISHTWDIISTILLLVSSAITSIWMVYLIFLG